MGSLSKSYLESCVSPGVAALQIRREKESGAVKLLARYKPEASADTGQSGCDGREEGKETHLEKNQHLYLKKECSPSGFSVHDSNGQERSNGHREETHSTNGMFPSESYS